MNAIGLSTQAVRNKINQLIEAQAALIQTEAAQANASLAAAKA